MYFNPAPQFSRLGILVSSSNFLCLLLVYVRMYVHGFVCIVCLPLLSILLKLVYMYSCMCMERAH